MSLIGCTRNCMKNLDVCKAYLALKTSEKTDFFPPSELKVRKLNFCSNHPLLSFSYATTTLNEGHVSCLQALADEQEVTQAYRALVQGALWGGNRPIAVQHHGLRLKECMHVLNDEQFVAFVKQVRGSKAYRSIVCVGIGGSYLGPEVLCQALKTVCLSAFDVFFIHSVDPCNVTQVLESVDFNTTLFVFSSKSGNTFETLENVTLLQHEAKRRGIVLEAFAEQCVGITCKGTELDGVQFCKTRFYITPEIGGRFSSTSAIGMLVVGLVYGLEVVRDLLDGAFELDQSAYESSIQKNPSLMAALVTVWERNVLGYSAKAIVPYSYGLSRFPAFLQQLICESNGKRVSLNGDVLTYATSPVVFGEPGTEAQHSFFQMLHQGTDITPVQFISLGKAASKHLYINLHAQRQALAFGNSEVNVHGFCPGKRPSTVVEIEGLSAKTLGALIAFYENMVMFEGFLWNINSFDQEGVQLGKILASEFYHIEES